MRQILFILLVILYVTALDAQSVGIGTQTPDSSAALDISSTTKGILVPRMTSAQREQIESPSAGLLVFDTTTQSFWFRNTNSWVMLVDSFSVEVHRNGPDMIYMGLTDSVGVGTQTPQRKFQVVTGDNAYGISHRSDSVELVTYVDNINGGWIGTSTNHPMNLFAGNGANKFTLLPNGNVGINNTAPASKLDITGTPDIPSIPGTNSTGIFRIGASFAEGIDIGKMNLVPYSGWIQAGYDGVTTDPLSLQPEGGNVGIGTIVPAESSVLDLSSTVRGFLAPRMTTAQRDAIVSPAEGLQILNLDDHCTDIFDSNHWIKNCGMEIVGMDTLGGWREKADLISPGRFSAASFAIDALGYFCTGSDVDFPATAKKDLWAYNPSTDIWVQKADFGGVGRYGAVSFTIAGKGYVGIGQDATNISLHDFWSYNPATNTWTARANLPGSGRSSAIGFSIGNDGYVVGGNNSKTVYKYNSTINLWGQVADYPITINRASAFSIGGKGYVGTGYSPPNLTEKFYEYNPTDNTWVQKANFGGGIRDNATGINIGGKGYMGLGTVPTVVEKKDLWEFDPLTNTWTAVPDLPGAAVEHAFGFSIGGDGYFGGGIADNQVKSAFYQYTPYSIGPVYSSPAPPIGTYSISDGIWTKQSSDAHTSVPGNIGIDFVHPKNKLDVHSGAARTGTHASGLSFYVTGDFLADSSGVEFRHNNGTQGIGFGYNTIYAAGANLDQNIGLSAKGSGKVTLSAGGLERMSVTSEGNVHIGSTSPAVLEFSNFLMPKAIVMYHLGAGDHQFSGFGLTANASMRYQTPYLTADHIFYAATSATSSNELMRIKGNGNVSVAGIIESEAFIQPTLLNGFTNYNNSFATAAYYKDKQGIVRLRGMVNQAANPTGLVIFTLPVGYRPSTSGILLFMTGNNNNLGRVDIQTNGDILVMVGSAGWFNLDGIAFRAD